MDIKVEDRSQQHNHNAGLDRLGSGPKGGKGMSEAEALFLAKRHPKASPVLEGVDRKDPFEYKVHLLRRMQEEILMSELRELLTLGQIADVLEGITVESHQAVPADAKVAILNLRKARETAEKRFLFADESWVSFIDRLETIRLMISDNVYGAPKLKKDLLIEWMEQP